MSVAGLTRTRTKTGPKSGPCRWCSTHFAISDGFQHWVAACASSCASVHRKSTSRSLISSAVKGRGTSTNTGGSSSAGSTVGCGGAFGGVKLIGGSGWSVVGSGGLRARRELR